MAGDDSPVADIATRPDTKPTAPYTPALRGIKTFRTGQWHPRIRPTPESERIG